MTMPGPTAMHSLVNAGNCSATPYTLTIEGNWSSAQTNQQAAPKRTRTTPCASLFNLFMPFSRSFDHCTANMSRTTDIK
jgi:hypothetical protein